MKYKLILAVVALAAFVAGGSIAAPSFFGYTGLIAIPNADTIAEKSFNVGYINVDLAGDDYYNFFGNYGLNENIEIGINRARIEGEQSETILNGKFRISAETVKRAGLAAGIIDATGETERTIYVVGSKSLGNTLEMFDKEITNIRLHFGIGSGGLDGLFVGASGIIGKRLAVLAEYDSENWNIGGRLYLLEGIRAHAGWLDVGGSDNFAFGVSFTKNF